jgi:predicted regulator of Ras-like GTPase activity (Roadblock/LC7/MglB family)
MGKILQIEELTLSITQYQGVVGCAVASRLGQGDILYDSNIGDIDRALLSTLISSIVLIGEKLGHEFGDIHAECQVVNYGATTAIITPGGENVALLVLVKSADDLNAIIAASREVAGKLADVVRNKAAGD